MHIHMNARTHKLLRRDSPNANINVTIVNEGSFRVTFYNTETHLTYLLRRHTHLKMNTIRSKSVTVTFTVFVSLIMTFSYKHKLVHVIQSN